MSLLTNIDLETFLEELGVETFGYNGDELIGRCPGHADKRYAGTPDRTPGNWSLNSETGQHHCFSCGFGGSLYWLVSWMRKGSKRAPTPADIEAARSYVARHAGDSLDVARNLTTDTYKRPEPRRVMDESRLALYTPPPTWALQARAIDAASSTRFGILWDPDIEAWITPIRDPRTAKLWGWQAKGQNTRLFRNLPSGVKKSDTLFGLEPGKTYASVVLVESPLDVARLDTARISSGLSSFGAIVSDEQMRVVCEATRTLVLALDNDAAGIKAMMALLGCNKSGRRVKSMRDWSQRLDIYVFNYTECHAAAKDPGDMDNLDIRAGVMHCIPASVRGPKAVLQATGAACS